MTRYEATALTTLLDATVGITRIILGSATMSVRAMPGSSLKFVGIGEKVEDLKLFYPDYMVRQILSMNNIVPLVKKTPSR